MLDTLLYYITTHSMPPVFFKSRYVFLLIISQVAYVWPKANAGGLNAGCGSGHPKAPECPETDILLYARIRPGNASGA